MTMRIGDGLEPIEQYLEARMRNPQPPRKHPWRYLWPTPKQAAVFSDRSMPKPATRGEAADQIKAIAKKEGWDQ